MTIYAVHDAYEGKCLDAMLADCHPRTRSTHQLCILVYPETKVCHFDRSAMPDEPTGFVAPLSKGKQGIRGIC